MFYILNYFRWVTNYVNIKNCLGIKIFNLFKYAEEMPKV